MRASLGVVLVLFGCSIVNDPSVHQTTSGMDGGADGGVDDGGAGDGGAPDAGPGVTPEEYCQTYASLLCVAYTAEPSAGGCCSRTPRPPFPNCEADVSADCLPLFSNLPPGLTFDGARAMASLAEARGYIESCSTDLANWTLRPDGYVSPLVGSLADDAVCTPLSAEPAAILHAVVSCGQPGKVCRPVTASQWRCRDRGIDGEDCTYGFECSSNRCNFNTFAADVCGGGNANGAICQRGRADQCMSLACSYQGTFMPYRCEALSQDALYCQGEGDG